MRHLRSSLSALFNLASEFAGKTWGKFDHPDTEHEQFKYSDTIAHSISSCLLICHCKYSKSIIVTTVHRSDVSETRFLKSM